MYKTLKALVFGSCTFGLTEFSPACSHPHGTRDEALALVKTALLYHEINGLPAALERANQAECQFQLKDLRVEAYDSNGTALAHGNPTRLGKNLLKIPEAKALFINPEFIKIGNSAEGKGWVQFQVKGGVVMTAYVEKHDDVYWVCSYRPEH